MGKKELFRKCPVLVVVLMSQAQTNSHMDVFKLCSQMLPEKLRSKAA